MQLIYDTWWSALQLAEKIYWIIAIPFTLIFVLQLILTFIGGDFGSDSDIPDHDVAVEHDHGIGFQYLSIKNLIGFFTIFGWTGIACLAGDKSLVFTVIVSSLAGLLMMLIMSTIVYGMGRLAEDGTLDLKNAVGKTGTVYLSIPSRRKGMGKVQINVQGFQTLDAFTDDDTDLKTGQIIKVLEVIDNEILLVKSQ
jgi:hypothetical protein